MKIHVTNIPVRGFAEGEVEIPDDTPPEGIQDALEAALKECEIDPSWKIEIDDNLETDAGLIDGGWEFNWRQDG